MLSISTFFQLMKWRFFLWKEKVPLDKRKSYISYLRRLLERNVPIVFEPEHLSALIGVEYKALNTLVGKPDLFYQEYSIPKRRGGMRLICVPYPELLDIQRWIYKMILDRIPVHESAHGFVVNRSVITNASNHVGKECLLKMDLADFFPSIKTPRVVSLFESFGYSPKVSYYLASLCCYEGSLPQGAATSPALSNLLSRSLDKRLSVLASKYNLTYSRYADDLTFSGDSIPMLFVKWVEGIVISEGFMPNRRKTKLVLRSGRRKIVTGVSVAGSEIKLPRETKRRLRQQVHYIMNSGVESHMAKTNNWDPILIDRIYGKLQFWKQVEPDNQFVNKALLYFKGK